MKDQPLITDAKVLELEQYITYLKSDLDNSNKKLSEYESIIDLFITTNLNTQGFLYHKNTVMVEYNDNKDHIVFRSPFRGQDMHLEIEVNEKIIFNLEPKDVTALTHYLNERIVKNKFQK